MAPENGRFGPLVVDVNIIAYHLLQMHERFSPLANRLAKMAPEWALPSLWQHEFANILATYVRLGQIKSEESALIFSAARAAFEPVEVDVDLGAALATANALKLTAYDAQYVLLAEKVRSPLITEDKKLIRQLPAARTLTLDQAVQWIQHVS